MLDDLMRVTGGVLSDGLIYQAQRELPWFEGARVVGFGRAAGADIAHLRLLQFGETAASGKSIPVEILIGMAPNEAPDLVGQVERPCWCDD